MKWALAIMIAIGIALGALTPIGPSRGRPEPRSSPTVIPSVRHDIAPSQPGAIVIERDAAGRFATLADVDGTQIRFLVDTGASVVALTQEDARAAHLAFDPALFTVIGHGASGPVRGQPVTIGLLTLGDKQVRDVRAVVLEDSAYSLLGQSFLGAIGSVTIERGRMTLR